MRLAAAYYGLRQIGRSFLGTRQVEIGRFKLAVYGDGQILSEASAAVVCSGWQPMEGLVFLTEAEGPVSVARAETAKPRVSWGTDSGNGIEVGLLLVVDASADRSLTGETGDRTELRGIPARTPEAKDAAEQIEQVNPSAALGAISNPKAENRILEAVRAVPAVAASPTTSAAEGMEEAAAATAAEAAEPNALSEELALEAGRAIPAEAKDLLSMTGEESRSAAAVRPAAGRTVGAIGADNGTELEQEPVTVENLPPKMLPGAGADSDTESTAEAGQIDAERAGEGSAAAETSETLEGVQLVPTARTEVSGDDLWTEDALHPSLADTAEGQLSEGQGAEVGAEAKTWPRWFYMDGNKLVILQAFDYRKSGAKLQIN